MARRCIAAVAAAALILCTATGQGASAAEATQQPPGSHEDFDSLLESWWQDYLQLNPALALAVADKCCQERFDESLTDEWRNRMLAFLRRYSARLHQFTAAGLSDEQRISLEMLRYRLDSDLSFYGSRSFEVARLLPINQFQGLHVSYAMEASGAGDYPFKTVTDYDNALRRADSFARWSEAAMRRMQEGMAQGITLPAVVVERMLPQLKVHLGMPPEQTQFWQPIQAMPADFPPGDRERLTKAFRGKIASVIQPAYQHLYDFLSAEYAPHAARQAGLGTLPGGRELYASYVRQHTTTDLSPARIHALGMEQVAQISRQLLLVGEATGHHGSLQDLFAAARADPQQHFAQPAEVLPAFKAARERIVPQLPQLFGTLPRAPYEIRALPDSYKTSRDNGYYSAPAADGSRPGVLWINIYAPGVQDRFNLMTISLHEGLPGHHLQASIAQERPDLPSFRRFDATNAYVEGWGLYAESLGEEMGFYADPWQRFGHLNYAILRADRLVIDTGIHAKGWSVEQATRWLTEHSSMNREQATAEVERYVACPGQALSYKIGELTLLQLRAEGRHRLGERFDLKAFHDEILRGGSMPLQILQRRMARWFAARGAATSAAAD